MGYRGKTVEQEQARELRARGLTMAEIATKLGVAKSSVSLWVRDVPIPPRPRGRPWSPDRKPSSLHLAKVAEIERLLEEGKERIGQLSERDLMIAGVAAGFVAGFIAASALWWVLGVLFFSIRTAHIESPTTPIQSSQSMEASDQARLRFPNGRAFSGAPSERSERPVPACF